MPGSRIFVGVRIDDLSKDELVKEAKKAIETHEMLRVFMNSVSDGFSILDKDMKYLAVNNAILERTGLSEEDLVGKYLADVTKDSQKSERVEVYKKILRSRGY